MQASNNRALGLQQNRGVITVITVSDRKAICNAQAHFTQICHLITHFLHSSHHNGKAQWMDLTATAYPTVHGYTHSACFLSTHENYP